MMSRSLYGILLIIILFQARSSLASTPPYERMTNDNNCGARCVWKILAFHGKEDRLENIVRRLTGDEPAKQGVTIDSLVKEIRMRGLFAEPVHMKSFNKDYFGYSLILHTDDWGGHFCTWLPPKNQDANSSSKGILWDLVSLSTTPEDVYYEMRNLSGAAIIVSEHPINVPPTRPPMHEYRIVSTLWLTSIVFFVFAIVLSRSARTNRPKGSMANFSPNGESST